MRSTGKGKYLIKSYIEDNEWKGFHNRKQEYSADLKGNLSASSRAKGQTNQTIILVFFLSAFCSFN